MSLSSGGYGDSDLLSDIGYPFYQRLFDDFRDFIKLELAKKETGLETMEKRYSELAERRRNLNEDMPEVTSKWYNKLDDSIYDEIDTHEQAKERLTGEVKLVEESLDRDLDESAKERLTGDANLNKDEKDSEED
ncbi:MAG: hypothetical protein ABEI86_01435 [Halobacteriaceae archaeon]